jgi:sulfatase modifying factor 1
MRRWLWLAILSGCEGGGGGPGAGDAERHDAEITGDSGRGPDSGSDLGGAGGAPGLDLGLDAEPDPGPDAGPDPGPDAGPRDAGLDAAPDLDADLDAEPDPDADPSAPDVSFGPCQVGDRPGECLPTARCPAPRGPVPGHCPGPADIQCCVEPDPEACDPNDFPQPNVGLAEAAGDPGCPAGMAQVADFCIDRYEASLVQADGAPWSPYHHPGATPVRAVSLAGAVPQGYIDGRTAQAACGAAGKRLCTDAEWLRTCRGLEERTYPYGDARQPGVCNDARARHPAVELFPNDPNPFARIQHPCINQLEDGLAPTGDHPGCVVPEGVFDLMGNLHEWTADPAGTFRGGFYVDTVINGPGCLYRTTAHDQGHWDYSTGFRCCADGRSP